MDSFKTTITTLEVPMKSIYVVENEHGCIKIGREIEDVYRFGIKEGIRIAKWIFLV